jgi:predicted lipoprotein with Yx(FWY)xxD motif
VIGLRRSVVPVFCALAFAAGCGGSSGPAADKPTTSSPDVKPTVVTTRDVPGYGTVLATAAGKPLYLLSADPKGGSKCDAACAKDWPPLTGGKPSADGKVDSSKLASFKRSDGDEQVLYNGHALYTYTGEELAGIGTKLLGGTWYLVSPKGEPIKTTATGGY